MKSVLGVLTLLVCLMVRHYKRKNVRLRWDNQAMKEAVKSVIEEHRSMYSAAQMFRVPYTSLCRRVTAERNQIMKLDDPIPSTPGRLMGHPAVLDSDMESKFANRLKYLEERGFGVVQRDVRLAAYTLAMKTNIAVPPAWEENKIAGKDWWLGFSRRNHLSLRKPEGLSKARAAGLNREAVNSYFELLNEVLTKFDLFGKPTHVYNMDETGLPLNNRPPRVVAEKGKKEVSSLTSVERGENVTAVIACNAAGYFIPPMIIFKGVRCKPDFKCNLPFGSVVSLTKSGYINEEAFMGFLEHFQKHRSPGKVLLILDGHGSHVALSVLEFCTEHDIELLALPPHTTHVLQPLDRSVFKTLKSNFHREATSWMQQNIHSNITKVQFNSLFTEAWKQTASVGLAIKGFACTGIFPFNPQAIQDVTFAPAESFLSTNTIEPFENDTKITTTTTTSSEPVTLQELDSQPGTSGHQTVTLEDSIREVIPSPKKGAKRKYSRAKKVARHATSPENIKAAKTQTPQFAAEQKVISGKRLKTDIKKKKSGPTRDETPEGLLNATIDGDGDDCGFCSVNYYSTKSTTMGDWLRCRKCKTWYHECCVGAKGKKMFTCGRCL